MSNDVESSARLLRPGCHVISFVPTHPRMNESALVPLVGTLRVVDEDGISFSGDLYLTGSCAPRDPNSEIRPEVFPANPGDAVPIFPYFGYHSYFRGLSMSAGAAPGGVRLLFERYMFDTESNRWSYAGSFFAELERAEASLQSPTPDGDFVGFVRDAGGAVIGVLSLTWANPFLRRARLRTVFEEGSEVPLDNDQGIDWVTVFAAVGWQLSVDSPRAFPAVPESGVWNRADLHNGMDGPLPAIDHDSEWTYRQLAVKNLDPADFDIQLIGVMFDNAQDDLNNIPRECFVVASGCVFSSTEPRFAAVAGQRVGDLPAAFFRAAAHELGHAMGLTHEKTTPHFMTPSGDVADLGLTAGVLFPDNIAYDFSPSSRFRLQHWPDVEVRPGGPYRGESNGVEKPPLPRVQVSR